MGCVTDNGILFASALIDEPNEVFRLNCPASLSSWSPHLLLMYAMFLHKLFLKFLWQIFSFLLPQKNKQNYIVRLTAKCKIFRRGKWFNSSVLRDSRKGKIKTTLTFREDRKTQNKTVYLTHLNVKITASRRSIRLVLVYGLGEEPMMLVTNKSILGKKDAIGIVHDYMSRWRVEEYFRFKIQHFKFE